MATEAQITANRQNSLRSTGPNSAEGKDRARHNALKHGLTADVLAVAGEDQAVIDQEREEWVAELAKTSRVAARFAATAFQAFVRLQRAERAAQTALGGRVRRAEQVLQVARMTELEEAVKQLDDSPGVAVARLRCTVEGCQWLKAAFEALIYRLQVHDWDIPEYHRAVQLLGVLENGSVPLLVQTQKVKDYDRVHGELDIPGGLRNTPEALSAAVDPKRIKGYLRIKAEGEAARSALRTFLEAQVADLTKRAAELERHAAAELEEAEVAALYDPSAEGRLRERYARSAEREMQRNHKLALEAEARRAVEAPEDVLRNEANVADAPATSTAPAPTAVPNSILRNEANSEPEPEAAKGAFGTFETRMAQLLAEVEAKHGDMPPINATG